MKILIVDDESLERKGIKYLIDKFKFNLEVFEANNGSTAKDFLSKTCVDILFTDLKMPLVDGLELSRYARQLYPYIKIILYSAYSEFEYAKTAIELGVVNYIVKPISFIEFKEIMQEVIEACKNEKEERKILYVYEHEYKIVGCFNENVSSNIIDDVKKLIELRYTEDLNLDIIAKQMHISSGYLSHLFKKSTGQPFIKYLNNYRLTKALNYLKHSHMKIVEISERVGYVNSSYFCKIFKTQYGCTPSEYRNREKE
ncbi:MAG: response regulator [Clostridiales bacterium]|nr:response regulator [Clostridiales bacterium]